jgi:deoxyribodipyrimidine photo-lyase
MSDTEIHPARVQVLKAGDRRDGRWVLYWMQQSQRSEGNHALEFAVRQANVAGLPLVVGFGLTDGYPEANLRHYRFMLEGLGETAESLWERAITFVLRRGEPDDVASELAREAAVVVCDRGYTRQQVAWRAAVAAAAECQVFQVEADVVVPVDTASTKAEFAARTLRPKIERLRGEFLQPLRKTPLRHGKRLDLRGESLDDLDALLGRLKLDRSVPAVSRFFRGGTAAARQWLDAFARGLKGYQADRNQPQTDHVSHLSKYLHFGQISPVEIALAARESHAPDGDRTGFLEELIVRRELAQNWVRFTPHYDRYEALPEWSLETLAKHVKDRREHVYTEGELERAETHDPYWNAAMREMRYTGYMHNAMRMYWGKKILEWSETPEEGFGHALRLNNRYFLDGRDPNSYANVGWIYGLHDRPWSERPIFGTVRYMSASGLERKCDIHAYVEKVERLVAEARSAGIRFPDERDDEPAGTSRKQGRLDLEE